MSNNTIVLEGIKEALQSKFNVEYATNVDYSRQGDVHSTAHYYSFTAKMANGNLFTVGINVNYIPYGGASHELVLTIEKNHITLKHKRIEVTKSQITLPSIKELLAEKFNIKL